VSPIPLGILAASGLGAAGAYDLLETQVLTSSASSVTFTGLGSYSDYKHLQIRIVSRNSKAATTNEAVILQLNGDTGSNYSRHILSANGSSVSSSGATAQTFILVGDQPSNNSTANAFYGHVVDILDFSSSSKNTTVRALGGGHATQSRIQLSSGLWMNTDSVTSITLSVFGGDNHVTGSRFSLYGVK
jgi:hypothetical protein